MTTYDVLIVGGGHGGAQAAIALRQRKFAGSIAIVGDEAELPYERPPLSKEYLSGDKPWERLLIRPAAFWAERDVTLLHARVTAVDAEARTVTLAPPSRSREGSGEGLSSTDSPADRPTPDPSREREGKIGYRHLIWATGGRPRRLSCAGHDLAGVHSVRSRADVDAMIAELPSTTRVCVVGGGYIGLEAASVLTKLGKAVTLIEAQDRVLARVAGSALSAFFAAEHRAHGVDLRLDTAVDSIVGTAGRASGVRLEDGEVVPCDMVVVGIGILPEVEPLLTAGAAGGNGVAVDAHCRTTLADVYAIGDCALHASAYADGATIRLESVANANDMATVAARGIVGDPAPYDAVPWFWSNQYDLKLQTVGLSTGHDTEIVRGDPATRSFSTIYLRADRVVALDCVNAVRDYVQGRALLLREADPARLADAGVPLKEIAAG